ncbi:MAG: hypothetical protein LBR77_01325 [Lachnospiraceae bacterium]|jgi:hypothetical protein|nr:hypothetical protein [Lachnospiraceae bacterium]
MGVGAIAGCLYNVVLIVWLSVFVFRMTFIRFLAKPPQTHRRPAIGPVYILALKTKNAPWYGYRSAFHAHICIINGKQNQPTNSPKLIRNVGDFVVIVTFFVFFLSFH